MPPSHSTPRHKPREKMHLKRHVPDVHSSSIYNSFKGKQPKCALTAKGTARLWDKDGTPRSNEREPITAAASYMDEVQNHDAQPKRARNKSLSCVIPIDTTQGSYASAGPFPGVGLGAE